MKLEDLPLFADDKELGAALLGRRAKDWPVIAKHYEGRGLPPVDSLFGGRYVPAVVKFFDALNGVNGAAPFPAEDGRENPWSAQNQRRRRV